jgi:hypothetical protein
MLNLKTKEMKNVGTYYVSQLVATVVLGVWLVSLSSCNKVHDKSFEELRSTYSMIGDYHQLGLDYILEDLKKVCNNSGDKPNFNELSTAIKYSSARFTSKVLKLDSASEKNLIGLQESISVDFVKTDEDPDLVTSVLDKMTLTSKEILYLSRLNYILSNINYNLDQCVSNIGNLEYEIYNNCSTEEISCLFTATSIATNSVVYWYNNYELWYNELNISEILPMKGTMDKTWFWGALCRMGKADIVGGITGGCIGAIVGGIGAIPGALAGACNASGNCGIVCLYEHLTQ